jgi:4-hydroxy-tetrahydrodipicolinate reductase
MRIALIGYGKMGRMIEEMAKERGHEIALAIGIENLQDFTPENLAKADVAIEFTAPDSAFENVMKCLDNRLPVVSGSTGWNEQLANAKKHCLEVGGSFIHASNFSIGVNLFFELNKKLAQLMAMHPEYEVSIKEIHHTQKKDAPSGTAVTLAEQIISHLPEKKSWQNSTTEDPSLLSIISERIDPAPGTHHVLYHSPIDNIEIIHTAHNRKGFALGAVLAAEFIVGKKGVFEMSDVLQLNSK